MKAATRLQRHTRSSQQGQAEQSWHGDGVGRALRGGRKMGEGWPLLLRAVLASVDDEAEAEASPPWPPSRASESTALISSSDSRTCARQPQNALRDPSSHRELPPKGAQAAV